MFQPLVKGFAELLKTEDPESNFSMKTCCNLLLELSRQDHCNEGSHVFMENKENYP